MDYLYQKLEYDANFSLHTPERKAFKKHLLLVAKALHDIEWVDSGDNSEGSENEAIKACLGDGAVLEAAIERAEKALADLRVEYELALAAKI